MDNVPPAAYPHITADPQVRAGRPTLSARRITVEDVVILRYRMGRSLEEIGSEYDLPLAALHSAMAYYHDHKAEIDRSIEEDDAYIDAMRRQNPSALREKLLAMRGQ